MNTVSKSIITSLLFGLSLGACATNPKGNNSGASSPAPVAPVTAVAPAEPEITLAEFDGIKKGMTYEQVVQIVGVNGEVMSSYDASDPKWSSKTYTFKGRNSYSTAMVSFTGGVVDTKMQSGLS